MKNFKKVIAFLMVAAMTLGMGLVAFADGDVTGPAVEVGALKAENLGTLEDGTAETAHSITVDKIKAVKAGETVTITVKAAKDMCLNSFLYDVYMDTSKVSVVKDTPNYNAKFDTWMGWAYTNLAPEVKYNETGDRGSDYYTFVGATSNNMLGFVESGTTLFSIVVKAEVDLAEGDVIATVDQINGYTDAMEVADAQTKHSMGEVVQVVIAAADAPSSSNSSNTPSSSNTPGGNTPGSSNTPGGSSNANQQAAANNGQATTAAESDLVRLQNSITDINKANEVVNALAKDMGSTDEATKAEILKLQTLINDMVKNPSKYTDAQKKDAIAQLKNLLAKVDAKIIAKLAPKASTTGKKKPGDTTPVVALVLVAIAAFGTAVVVYRKKVNA